jgi:hypothetical protein
MPKARLMNLPRFTLRRLFVLLTLVCVGVAAWVACQVVYLRERILGVDGITVWAMDDPPVIVAFQGLPHDGSSYYQGYVPVAGWTYHWQSTSDNIKSEYKWGERNIIFNNVYRLTLRNRGKQLTVCGVDYALAGGRPIILLVENDQRVRQADNGEKEALLAKVQQVTRDWMQK